jgi:hypothetical protein
LFHRASCARWALVAAAIACSGFLGACSTGQSAMVESIREVLPFGKTAAAAPSLDPKFAYLRITRGKHVGLLWRGDTERSAEGVVEVYYSGGGEVVRLLDGRIVGALGLVTEWRKVSLSAPSWRAVAGTPGGASFVRVRDVMPGYRSGIRDQVTVRPITAPAASALRGVDAKALAWFEERIVPAGSSLLGSRGDERDRALPTARYAVDLSQVQEQVVYAEQCLAADLCFTWQRWSQAMQQAVAAR